MNTLTVLRVIFFFHFVFSFISYFTIDKWSTSPEYLSCLKEKKLNTHSCSIDIYSKWEIENNAYWVKLKGTDIRFQISQYELSQYTKQPTITCYYDEKENPPKIYLDFICTPQGKPIFLIMNIVFGLLTLFAHCFV